MSDWLNRCHFGDVRDVLQRMIADGVKVQTIVTSPPYWGLRSYLPADHPDKHREIGSEPTLREFLDTMVGVFDLCHQVLADDGTMWVNMGDSYATSTTPGFKSKDLLMQPHRLAIALQDAGWYVRQDIVWGKPNPMPESSQDRCTKAHEYIFLLSKSRRYYCDMKAIREPANLTGKGNANTFRGGAYVNNQTIDNSSDGAARTVVGNDTSARAKYKMPDGWDTGVGGHGSFHRQGREKGAAPRSARDSFKREDSKRAAPIPGQTVGTHRPDREESEWDIDTANKRSVWTVATEAYPGSHYATFPMKLIEPCVLAGAPAGGIVLDIFMGSGTTAQVAEQLGRQWIGIDIDTRNKALQDERLRQPSLALDGGTNFPEPDPAPQNNEVGNEQPSSDSTAAATA